MISREEPDALGVINPLLIDRFRGFVAAMMMPYPEGMSTPPSRSSLDFLAGRRRSRV